MTRLPRVGKNKTRLIPALGPAGAMKYHDRLARHAIGRASAFSLLGEGRRLAVSVEGGTPLETKEWLGDTEVHCEEQASGDLGARMRTAAENAFSRGARKVVVIGTDCPSIDERLLTEAERLLDHHGLVYGPALDGGYYLLGMKTIIPEIFEEISWGGNEVLAQSIAAARKAGIEPALLQPLPDVDHPEDLPAAEETLAVGSSVSVIVAAWNEAENISRLLEHLRAGSPHEIIVSVGDSSDRTAEIAALKGARVVRSNRGRAAQLNAGARSATGEFLLFLHADTFPPAAYPSIILRELQRPGTSAGAFRFRLEDDFGPAPLIEALVSLRAGFLKKPYGDQGLFLRRNLFESAGGYPETPIMEDALIVKNLAKMGTIRIACETALTSARRWKTGGLIRTFLRHQAVLLASLLRLPGSWIIKLRP